MTEKTHGYNAYANGCRCEVCRAAKAAYMRTKRAATLALSRRFTDDRGRYLAQGITHGTAAGYVDYRCRCRPCTTAATAKTARERRAQMARRFA